MRGEFLERVESTDDDVKAKPEHQEPTRPIVAEQQKNTTDDGKQTNPGNHEELAVKRAIFKVIEQANRACKDEQAAEDDDGQRALHISKFFQFLRAIRETSLRLSEENVQASLRPSMCLKTSLITGKKCGEPFAG